MQCEEVDERKIRRRKSALEYYYRNKDKVLNYQKSRKEEIRQYHKKYRIKYRTRRNKLDKQRKEIDPLYKLSCNLRSRITEIFRKRGNVKITTSKNLLGTDFKTVMVHIESQFKEGMTWENYGKWHIDHIIPLASAITTEEVSKLFHYKNLQPLWAEDNLRKNCKMN